MHDPVNSPAHYAALAECSQCGAEVETVQVTERMNFNRGNAVKYAARAGRKGDARQEVEDLRKGAWYLTREADRLQALLDEADRVAEDGNAQAGHQYGPGGWTGTPPSPEAAVALSPAQQRNLDALQKSMAKASWSVKPPGVLLDLPMPMSHARRTWLDRLLNL